MALLHLGTNPLTEHEPFTVEGFVSLVQKRAGNKCWYDTRELTLIAERILHWTNIFKISPRTVAAQILHETGFFMFGGDVYFWQFNFAGLGATGKVIGHMFTKFKDAMKAKYWSPTTRSTELNSYAISEADINIEASIDAGVLAVVVHHYVYLLGHVSAWPDELQTYRFADPRYDAVVKANLAGSVRTIEGYGGKWAYPGIGYGQKIVDIGNLLPVQEVPVSRPLPFVLPFPLEVAHIPWDNSNNPRQTALASGRGWITIHETGNPKIGANALMHKQFTHGKNGWGGGGYAAYTDSNGVFHETYEGVSFTYVIDDSKAFELMARGMKTWQASDGANGPGNSSVSIELCINADGNWIQAKENLAQLVVWLIANDPNLSLDRIVQHNHWARDQKNCPTKLRANNNREWNQLMNRIREIAATKSAPPTPPVDPNALEINGFWIINDIYHVWRDLGPQALPLVGFPTSRMFEGPVDGVMRDVQIFERGALAVYKEGTQDGVPKDHPFHVRMLTPAEYDEVVAFGVREGHIEEVEDLDDVPF